MLSSDDTVLIGDGYPQDSLVVRQRIPGRDTLMITGQPCGRGKRVESVHVFGTGVPKADRAQRFVRSHYYVTGLRVGPGQGKGVPFAKGTTSCGNRE